MQRRARTALVCLLSLALPGCGPAPGPEEAVRAWIDEAAAAVEAKDRQALTGMISESYTDSRGNSRNDLERIFRVYFLRSRSIVLASKTEEVEVMADSAARVLLTAGMIGAGEGTFDFDADAYRFELELEKQGRRWLLVGARWARLGDELR